MKIALLIRHRWLKLENNDQPSNINTNPFPNYEDKTNVEECGGDLGGGTSNFDIPDTGKCFPNRLDYSVTFDGSLGLSNSRIITRSPSIRIHNLG